MAVLSPEARLILRVAGSDGDEEIRTLARLPLDWGKVLWLAEQERAASRLWQRVGELGITPPPDEASRLQALAMVSDFRMLHLRQRLEETVRVLAASGIEVVLLKGAALAELVYGSFTERPMHDVDLLVAPGRAEEARQLLTGAGWSGAVDARLAWMYEHHHHLPPLSDASGTGTNLELHTSLFLDGHPFTLTSERVWAGARPITIGGVRAHVPGGAELLLHSALHFAWSNLLRTGAWRTFRDIDRLVASGQVDWPVFVSLARESRAETLCYWTFRLARRTVGVPVPDRVLDALTPGLPELVLRRLERHYVLHLLQTEWACPSVAVGYRLWEAGMRPRRSGFGAARPWAHEDRIRPFTLEEARPMEKFAKHLRRLGQWRHYLKLLLEPARAG